MHSVSVQPDRHGQLRPLQLPFGLTQRGTTRRGRSVRIRVPGTGHGGSPPGAPDLMMIGPGPAGRSLRFPSVRPRVHTSDGARLTVPCLSRGIAPVQTRGIEVPRSIVVLAVRLTSCVGPRAPLPAELPPKPNRHRLAPPFGSGSVPRLGSPAFPKVGCSRSIHSSSVK